MTESLSQKAQDVIASFSQLNIGPGVQCPYFNNRRSKVRAGLRVTIGKGSPTDIEEEARILSFREHVDLDSLSKKDTAKFLINHNIGIDCSGFAYYVLHAELCATKKKSLSSILSFPGKNLLRRLLSKMRTVENTNVETLSHSNNSHVIELSNIQPGDMFIILKSGKEHSLDHILLVSEVEKENNTPAKITYVHSFRWSTDGNAHGVRKGTITITDKNKSFLDQRWEEQGKKNKENETYLRANDAKYFGLHRLNS